MGTELKSHHVSSVGKQVLMKDLEGRDALRLTTYLPAEPDGCGLLADLALRAAGLTDGDRYRYRFEGRVSTERLRQDAAERTHLTAALAPREWQAAIFRRMSKSLRASSSAGTGSSAEEKPNDRNPR
jgi:hypothetical protein